MISDGETSTKLVKVQQQLSLARTEINNLRKEIKSLKYLQTKEINNIKSSLENWQCSSCGTCAITSNADEELAAKDATVSKLREGSIILQPIGVISTGFVEKRAVPRQPNVNLSSNGKISLCNCVFTNPEHSLEGLEGFSHMWILFYFHKNQTTHVQAKVSPPRLNGTRVGVFGSRSPHRPCPIGLSLVKIDQIEGSTVYFSGVDMLDGTPVLDLKPYIPHYDNPIELNIDYPGSVGMERLALDGEESDPENGASAPPITINRSPNPTIDRLSEREAPDGEEGQLEASGSALGVSHSPLPVHRHVRVPEWISHSPVSQLQVTFTPQAESFLSYLNVEENIKRVITDILREDPRSVFLRDRYANQFYTFLINNYHIKCKFDDSNHVVKVFRIVPAGTMCECGQPEWQCSTHGGAAEI